MLLAVTNVVFQIYTDWANHYLEKARCKKLIQDLQQDVTDGVLLADLVESVSKYSNQLHSNHNSIYIAIYGCVRKLHITCVEYSDHAASTR